MAFLFRCLFSYDFRLLYISGKGRMVAMKILGVIGTFIFM